MANSCAIRGYRRAAAADDAAMDRRLGVLLATLALFALSDCLGRACMRRYGFCVGAFTAPWFGAYMLIRTVATFGQLYVVAGLELGTVTAMLAGANIVVANALGFFLLGEVLSAPAYAAIALACASFAILAIAR